MERHLSTGVATIVALMAAHRAAGGGEGVQVAYCPEEVARIDAYLLVRTNRPSPQPPRQAVWQDIARTAETGWLSPIPPPSLTRDASGTMRAARIARAEITIWQ